MLLARDRLGIKPLYYCITDKYLVFGSEMKAILADPAVDAEIAPEIIDRFLTFLYLPGEETLFKSIKKLAPGHYLLVRNGQPEIHQYWDLAFTKTNRAPDLKVAEEELLHLLAESVELHMIADVPVGVLLSGGVDSTAVLSFAAERTTKEINTYTVGFSDPGVADERPYARMAAERFGTRHHDTTVTPEDFASFMPHYIWHMEEPVCEPPAIALYYISKMAASHVKVLLSGEGGDEAFAGYSNYRNLLWLERFAKMTLNPLAGMVGGAMSAANLFAAFSARGQCTLLLMGAAFPGYYYGRTSNPFPVCGKWFGQAVHLRFRRRHRPGIQRGARAPVPSPRAEAQFPGCDALYRYQDMASRRPG